MEATTKRGGHFAVWRVASRRGQAPAVTPRQAGTSANRSGDNMNTNHKMIGTVASLIAGVLVLSALEADARGSPSPAWYKPPWPCVVVRADLPGMPRFGVCPAPNVARRYVARRYDTARIGDSDKAIVLTLTGTTFDAKFNAA